ncbi:MAG: T9SS type A sorting domain-containing protein [Bacteroidetes bacterium]|nr:T9SS type A sorting domain-containing protein [Bacteroidota bacterium]
MRKKIHSYGNWKLFSLTRVTGMIFMLLATVHSPVKALVSSYSFVSSAGTYTPVTGTILFSGNWDDASSGLITLPFTFNYNNTPFTTLSVTTNGFITLGAIPAGTLYCGLQTSPTNSIAAYGTDLINSGTSSNIQYATLGVTPNRQFVVQWTNCKHFGLSNTDAWNFQLILNESDNSVQVVWGASAVGTTMNANACADNPSESGSVGLKGYTPADFNLRSVTNGTNDWTTSVSGASLSDVCNISPSNIPPSGITYTWTPSPPAQMVFVSGNTVLLNNGAGVPISANRQVYQVQVVVAGSLSPLDVTSLSLSTSGCTNASTDIANAKVFFTGSSPAFSSATQFGSTVNNPDGAYTVNGVSTLSEGINYFWITYDINLTATLGDLVTGCCTSFTGTGSIGTQTPSVTCPAGSQTIMNLGSWTPVTSLAPHYNQGGMLLLSDGTAICHSNDGGLYGKTYDKLTPDQSGSYINGTWSSIAPMISDRLFYSSQVLKDGRVYVAGGEYGAGLTVGEVYDPLTNSWAPTPSPGRISDANSEILEDGRVLQALVQGTTQNTVIYNPATNSYVTGPNCTGGHNESVWVKLPDNSILFVNIGSVNSERYIPSLNAWVPDATVPVSLYDPYGYETGGAVLLPNGKAFFLGSLGTTAYYTPSGTSSPGTWAAGPTIPNSLGAPDASCAMMANGKVLCAFSPAPVSQASLFVPPTYFYEFDYLTNSFAQTSAPGGGTTLTTIGSFQTCMLNLPDGTVLYAQNQDVTSQQYYIYTPSGSQTASGKPHIDNIQQLGCDIYTLSGTQFNGISEGASYGDDWQSSTNYPIVRLTSGSNVYFCRTSNWNSTGVMRGNAPDNVTLTLPAGLPYGTYSMIVSANGISSDPVSFTTGFYTWYNDLDGDGYYGSTQQSCMNPGTGWSLTTLGPDCNDNDNTVWQSASLYVDADGDGYDAGSAVVCYGATAPIGYSLTTNGSDCNDSDGSIHTPPTVSFSGLSASYCINAGAVTLTGSPAGGIFSGTGINGNIFDPATAGAGGPYTITYSYTAVAGCSNSSSQTVTVNDLPSVSFTGLSASYCVNAGAVTLTGIPAGGSFSGNGISGNSFNPATAGVGGPYSITYTYTDGNSCLNSSSQTVTVNALPAVSFTGLAASYCVNAGAASLTGIPAGGTFSGTGITGNSFNPLTAGIGGPYTIAYSYTDGNSCLNSSSQVVSVNALPVVSFSGLAASYCINAGVVTLTGTPSGGTFSGSGITGNSFNPATAGVGGPYSITYSYTNGNSCLNSSIQTTAVNALPIVSFTGLSASYCANAAAVTLTGSPAGGTFSGPGISGNSFNPSTAGAGGPYTITYTYMDGNSCLNSSTHNVTVNPLPVVSFTGLAASYCVYANSVTLTGSPAGGTFSGPGISGNLFNPAAAGVGGPYSITYSFTNGNGCSSSSSIAVTVKPTPNAIATPASQISCSGTPITSIVLSGVVPGTIYNWTRNNTSAVTGINASGSGNISGVLTNTTINPVTVTFTITPSANGCTNTSILATVLVNPQTKITCNPDNKSISVSDNTSFSVTATGIALTYQWQQSTNGGTSYSNLTNGGVYSGVATNKLNLTSVPVTMNGYKFRCLVTGTCSSVTSASALLTVTYPCQNATGLTTTNITYSAAKLNWSANADPAQWQVQYKTTNNGSMWKDVFVAGNLRTVTISALLANQNYNWHIRAKCGENWTAYSATANFKTSPPPLKATPAINSADETSSVSLNVYPNPSKGEFTLILQVDENTNTKAKIQMVNMMGKTVYTEDAEIGNGLLQKTISTPSAVANGIYIVRVIIDEKLYKTQVILLR